MIAFLDSPFFDAFLGVFKVLWYAVGAIATLVAVAVVLMWIWENSIPIVVEGIFRSLEWSLDNPRTAVALLILGLFALTAYFGTWNSQASQQFFGIVTALYLIWLIITVVSWIGEAA